MSPTGRARQLADAKYLTLVVRCVLNDHGQIDHGELIDAMDDTRQRFKGWRGLIHALSSWAKAHAPPEE